VWAILMLQAWKRREKYVALEWGMAGFGVDELNRPGTINPVVGLIYLLLCPIPLFLSSLSSSLPPSLPLPLLFWLDCVEFKGESQQSIVTGRKIFFFTSFNRRLYIVQSAVVILALTACVIGTVDSALSVCASHIHLQ
jgi:hypothetical protein